MDLINNHLINMEKGEDCVSLDDLLGQEMTQDGFSGEREVREILKEIDRGFKEINGEKFDDFLIKIYDNFKKLEQYLLKEQNPYPSMKIVDLFLIKFVWKESFSYSINKYSKDIFVIKSNFYDGKIS